MKKSFLFFFTFYMNFVSFGQIQLNSPTQVDELIYTISQMIEQHDYLDELEQKSVIDIHDWMRVYDIVFPSDPSQVELNSHLVLSDLKESSDNQSSFASLAGVVELHPRNALEDLRTNILADNLSVLEVERILDQTQKISREVIAAGIYNSPRFMNEVIQIKVDPNFQFLESNYSLKFMNSNSDESIPYDITNGNHTINLTILKDGQLHDEFEVEVHEEKIAESYKSQYDENWRSKNNIPKCSDAFLSQTLAERVVFEGTISLVDPSRFGNTFMIPGYDNVLDRILIITDGIDFVGNRGPKALLEEMGGIKALDPFLKVGIDVLFVDWPYPMGRIENNSNYLKNIIADLNALDDFESIVAYIGISMGGIIGRHALIDLEDNQIAHNVDIFVSGDSPQKGANVSVGIQAAVLEGNLLKTTEEGTTMAGIINSAASKQMLKFHVDKSDYDEIRIGKLFGLKWAKDMKFTAAPNGLFTELQTHLGDRYPQQTSFNLAIADGTVDQNVVPRGSQIMDVKTGPAHFRTFASDGFEFLGFRTNIVLHKQYNSIINFDHKTTLINSTGNLDADKGSTFNVTDFETASLSFVNKWCYQPTSSALGFDGDASLAKQLSPFDDFLVAKTNLQHTFTKDGQLERKFNFLIDKMDKSLFSTCYDCDYEGTEIFDIEPKGFANRVHLGWGAPDNFTYVKLDHVPEVVEIEMEIPHEILDIQFTNLPILSNSILKGVTPLFEGGNLILDLHIDLDKVKEALDDVPFEPGDDNEANFIINLQSVLTTEGCTVPVESELNFYITITYDIQDELFYVKPNKGGAAQLDRLSLTEVTTKPSEFQMTISPNPVSNKLSINNL